MHRAIIIALALALLFGCIQPLRGNEIRPAQNSAQNLEPQGTEPAYYPQPSTANLTFERNASGVMNTDTEIPEPPNYDFTNMTTEDGRPIVRYFHSRHCPACKALRPEIERLGAQYSGVEWREYDIVDAKGAMAYRAFADQYNLTHAQRLVPQVLVNGTIITDRFSINSSLEGVLKGLSAP